MSLISCIMWGLAGAACGIIGGIYLVLWVIAMTPEDLGQKVNNISLESRKEFVNCLQRIIGSIDLREKDDEDL